MNPQDFLQAVLPTAGVYCVAEFSSAKKEHAYASSIDVLMQHVNAWHTAKKDVYFALGSFVSEGSRESDNVLFLRSAFMDMDCGEGKAYASKKDAAAALDAFIDSSGLSTFGTPWVVSSGWGLHVYWSFSENIPVSSWKAAAENLKRLAKEKGLRIDFGVTADASRVLRVPGTTNFKKRASPKQVMLLAQGTQPNIDFKTFAGVVLANLEGAPVAEQSVIPGKRLEKRDDSAATIKLMENSSVSFRTILQRSASGAGCEQLAYYINNAASDGMEPLWRAMLSIAKPCTDGEKAAKKLSEMHPYPESRMHTKLREIKGPYPCTKIDSENPGICTQCPHWGKITNPLALGREIQTDNTEKVVELVVSQDTAPILLTRPEPPKGFAYGKTGGVFRTRSEQDPEGNSVVVESLVLPYDLFALDVLNVNGVHSVHMVAMRPEGPAQVVIPQKAIVSKDDTVKALAEQNVVAAFGANNDKNLFDYVRACVEDISSRRKSIKVPSSYGWQDDDSFVYSGKIYTGNMAIPVPMAGLENITYNTGAVGTLAGWRRVIDLLIKKELWDVLSMGLVGFGAPLMRFTGFNGMTFHIGSTNSGTGKTLALELASSVWGNPEHYRVTKDTSHVAMQQRLGLLRNLPLVTDEITSKNRNGDFEWFTNFLFDMTQGRGKERMESGANKERLNLSTWCSLAIMSSNTHVVDYLTGDRKHASEGELYRILELTLEEKLHWEPDELDLLKTLKSNFGVAGHAYVSWLVNNVDTARQVTERVAKHIAVDFKSTNDERFWMAGVSALVAGGVLAGRKYANIVDFPMEQLIESLRRIVERVRESVRGNARTADDILNAYTREKYGQFVIIRSVDGRREASYGLGGPIDESLTRTNISGRVEHGIVPGHANYYIEERLLRTYCAGRSFGYSDFKRQMERLYKIEYVKKDLLSGTRGPSMRVSAMKICRPLATLEDEVDPLASVPVE